MLAAGPMEQAQPPDSSKAPAERPPTAGTLLAASNEKIIKGLQAMREAGARMTQGALAAAAGISLRTVKARWDWIRQGCKPVPVSGIAAPAQPAPMPLLVVLMSRRRPERYTS
jgi:hypothetical protein